MPRKHIQKTLCSPPLMMGFNPYGIASHSNETLVLTFDEFECIKLLDYELLTHDEAAVRLNVSRPTLTRIYERARRTIAKAFVEGKSVKFSGGEVVFDKDWLRCKNCFMLFPGIEHHKPCGNCKKNNGPELVPVQGT